MYNTIASIPDAKPFGRPAACVCRTCAVAAEIRVAQHRKAAKSMKTTCFVGDMSTLRGPM